MTRGWGENHWPRGIGKVRARCGVSPRGVRDWNLLVGWEASGRVRTPGAALEDWRLGGGGAVSRGAGEQGGRGQPGWGGGSVHTRLGRGNYNPTVAPAYRATSDPSKRVAWEFGWRQRPAGEARSAATTATAPPLPQSGRRSCAVGGKGLDRARGGHSLSGPSPPLTPGHVTAPKGTQRLPSSPGLELCYTALTLKAVHMVYIICNHPPLYNTRPSA